MSHKWRFLSGIITFAQVVALAAVMALSHGGAGAGATGSITISGTVTDQNGLAVSNVSVYAIDTSNNNEYGPTTTSISGQYTLNVDAGTYDFHFDPPTGSNLNPVVESSVPISGNQTINVQMTPITHTFSGTLTDQNGNPISGVIVQLIPGGASKCTDANGNFSFKVNAGSYTPSVDWSPNFGCGSSNLFSNDHMDYFDLRGANKVDLTNGDVTQNIQLNVDTVTVTLKDSNGNAIPNTEVQASPGGSGSTTLFTNESTSSYDMHAYGNTDSNGTVQLPVFQGLTFGQSAGVTNQNDNICANTSSGNVCIASPLTVTGDTTYLLQQAPPTPSEPANLSAPSPSQLPNLSWTAATDATSYNIYRNGNPTPIGSSTNTTYADSSAPEGTDSYYVTAVFSSRVSVLTTSN